jgi:hypothetical protein
MCAAEGAARPKRATYMGLYARPAGKTGIYLPRARHRSRRSSEASASCWAPGDLTPAQGML